MKTDRFGHVYFSTDDICDQLYVTPDLDLSKVASENATQYNKVLDQLFLDWERLIHYAAPTDDQSIEEFDRSLQTIWFMPDEYKELDIAQYVLDRCSSQAELQRAGEELLLYQDRDMFDLLRVLKYIADTLKKNNIVCGVGRGSSVASFVLYLLGVHRINSLYYDLDIAEFLR